MEILWNPKFFERIHVWKFTYIYIWFKFMLNVGKHSIHGAYD